MVGPANVVEVEVEGIGCDALVDTGLMVTTIAESFWRTKLASVPLRPLQDLIRVEGANGLEVKYLGFVEVSLRMRHGIAGPEQTHRAPVLVVVDTQYNAKVPLIIGTYIIRCCYMRGVDHSGTKFWLNTQVQPAWHMAFDTFQASTTSPKVKVQLVTNSQIQLAPGEAALLEGQTTVKWRHSLTSKSKKSPLIVDPLLVETPEDEPVKKIFIEVKNGSQKTITLTNVRTLCCLEQVTLMASGAEVIENVCLWPYGHVRGLWSPCCVGLDFKERPADGLVLSTVTVFCWITIRVRGVQARLTQWGYISNNFLSWSQMNTCHHVLCNGTR